MNSKLRIIALLGVILINPLFAQEVQNNTELPQSANNTALDSIKQNSGSSLTADYVAEKEYILADLRVTGLKKFSEKTVKLFTGLNLGQVLRVPGDKLSSAIKKPS